MSWRGLRRILIAGRATLMAVGVSQMPALGTTSPAQRPDARSAVHGRLVTPKPIGPTRLANPAATLAALCP